jgi:hypothetical protein
MKDPTRLLHEGATPAELALLRAGASEEPSEEGMQRLSAALGLGTGALVTLGTKSTAPGPGVGGALSKITAKWVIAGAVGLAGGTALVLSRSAVAPEAAHAPPSGAPHVAAPVVTSPPEPAEPAGQAAVAAPTDSQASEATPVPAESKDGARASRKAASQSIAREIADLDGARRLLGAGDARGALRALDTYDAEARSGMLRQEASLLRIEALAAAGDLASARRLARAFLRQHPQSPHEARVRALVGETP